jgi:hypothetical protein
MEKKATFQHDISELSGHLFWDTPPDRIDGYVHQAFIVERVMGYGTIEDWNTIKRWYGKAGLRSIVVGLRELDDVSLAFLCLVLDLKKEDFRCYNEQQLQPGFWNS